MRFLFALLLFTTVVSAQLSKKHWIPPIHAKTGETFVKDHYVYLSTPETTPFQVTITSGDGLPIAGSPFTISSGNPVRVSIGMGQPSVMFLSKSDVNIVKSDKGLILEGSKEFYATFKVRADNHAEILVAKGYQGVGTAFRLGGLPQTSGGSLRNFFASFMATEDNTTVTLSDYDENVEFVSSGANYTDDTQTFTLNAGESMTVSGYSEIPANLTGFIGALVTSDRPIAVNTGNALAGMSSEEAGQDFTFDQIVPLEEVGTEYVVIKGNGSGNVETPLVIATEDNTQVFINGSGTAFTTLNAGEYSLIPTSMYQGVNNKNMYITSSKPVYLYQIIGGAASDATSGLNFIPPLSCYFQKSIDLIPSINSIGSTTYNSEIIALTYAGSSLTVNFAPVTALPEPVLGNPQWVTYRLSGYTGNIRVHSTGPLAVGMFGSSNAVGFAGYYSGFGSEPRNTTLAVCSNTTTDLFENIEGNPDPGGTWSPALASGTGVFNPAVDPPGVYNYNFTGLCAIVNVAVTVTVEQAMGAGTDAQITVCKNDPTFNLFTLLGSGATAGGTWSPALASGTNIFNPAVDVSGNYKYTIAGTNVCQTVFSTVAVTVNPLPVVTPLTDYALCDDNIDGDDTNGWVTFNLTTKTNEALNNQTGIAVTYHKLQSEALSGSNPITSLYSSGETIYVRLRNTTTQCFVTTPLKLVVNKLPIINNNQTLKQCDDNLDAITSFNLTQANSIISTDPNLTFSYFTSAGNAQNNLSPITNDTAYSSGSGTVWVRITNAKGCYRITNLNLVVSTSQIPSTSVVLLEECDTYLDDTHLANDGFAYFNLNLATTSIKNWFPPSQSGNITVTYYENAADALAEENAIPLDTPYENSIANEQIVYVRVDNNTNNDCVGFGPNLKLIVNPIPEIDLGTDFVLCLNPQTGLGSQSINATPSNSGNFSYNWTPANPNVDGSGLQSPIYNVTQPGTYSVTVTETTTNCLATDSITVSASSEPLTVSVSLITPLFSSGLATIQATASGGYGVYEYSIDGVMWQPDGIFSGLQNGSYIVTVRDIEGCGTKSSDIIYTITYPSFFTPNGDGYNDTWNIANLKESYNATIYIFDRYGKLLKEFSPYSRGWDGNFNGNLLPATDYWFKIEYTEQNIRKEFKSHFALKR